MAHFNTIAMAASLANANLGLKGRKSHIGIRGIDDETRNRVS